jgi:hypothetical protein
VRNPEKQKTHLDPDWANLTYGDFCRNRRARALLSVIEEDLLLFWALLWRIKDYDADVFDSNDRGWYLIGALRVQSLLKAGQSVTSLPPALQGRGLSNAHMRGNSVETRQHVRVFIGNVIYSMRFESAVDLQIRNDNGLLRRTIRSKKGLELLWDRSPRWSNSIRLCRAILDIGNGEDRAKANIIRDAIAHGNPGYHLLADIK